MIRQNPLSPQRLVALLSLLTLLSIGLTPVKAVAEGMVLKGIVETNTTMGGVDGQPSGKGIIGVDLAIRPERYPLVRDVFRYSPAHFAGIRPGDIVMAVNGVSTQGRTSEQVDALISDKPGDLVTLSVRRGESVRNMEVMVTSLANAHPELKRYFVSYSY